jgi:hypothetical protein
MTRQTSEAIIDPITLLATASAIWSGIKKASEFAQEAEGVFSQLSKYCGVADQLEQVIQKEKNEPKKLKLFGGSDDGNDTAEAFNAFEAEHKLRQMEAEIRHEFLYGAFCNLEHGFGGMDGYAKFCNMRREIRARRIKAKQEQEQRQQDFWDNFILWVGGSVIIGAGIFICWMIISLVIEFRG